MDDLDLCKRIAEIEGESLESINKKVHDWNHKYYPTEIQLGHAKTRTLKDWYNPLTDDNLCFKLMVKYKIGLRFSSNDLIDAYVVGSYEITDTSPNKAICLAIIEANNETIN